MKKLLLIIFICFGVLAWGQDESGTVKEQLLSGLDQLEDLVLGWEKSLLSLQQDAVISQQIIDDMESIQWAQATYINQLRGQFVELDKIDQAKSQYIVLLQSRQRKYRIAIAVGVPAGIVVGVVGGVLLSHFF